MSNAPVLLVAVDYGDATHSTINHAAQMARILSADMVLLHSVEHIPDVPYALYVEGREESIMKKELERLEELGKTFSAPGEVSYQVNVGRADLVILKAARTLDATAIVIGAARKPVLEEIIVGVTAENIVRGAECPVFIHHPSDRLSAIKRIACAVDFSEHSRATLETGVDLCRWLEAELLLVHAARIPRLEASMRVISETIGDALDPLCDYEHDPELISKAEVELRKLMAPLVTHDIKWSTVVRIGSPAAVIEEVIRERDVDMAVIGSKGHHSKAARLLGGTATRVVRNAPCSLLVVESLPLFETAKTETPVEGDVV
jgi:nucleotide-binding universal stress UspA family protein